MKLSLIILILSVVSARADYGWAENQYTDHPDILSRVVSAAENDKIFKSHGDDKEALYLVRAEYLGPLDAPFGTVHVAKLCYIRSGLRGTKYPGRGHNYVVFLDQNFRIRTTWLIDSPDDPLFVEGKKLMSDTGVVFDYSHLPIHPAGSVLPQGTILYDNKALPVPKWD